VEQTIRVGREFQAGEQLPSLVKGPWSTSRIVRWCAAQENWDRIHYDVEYARDVAKLPYTVINGALKQHLLVQCLEEAFGESVWIWRLDYRFTGMDLVGQTLRVEGTVRDVAQKDGRTFVSADIGIRNVEEDHLTTEGTAVVIAGQGGQGLMDAIAWRNQSTSSDAWGPVADPEVPQLIRERVGTEIEHVTSYSAVDLGRLRLFAEAVMDVRPHHYDVAAGAASRYGGVVALPLFPIHALSRAPGERQLSTDALAFGREGSSEVGRNLAQIFGMPSQGVLNGGNRVQIHSLLRPGEAVRASSRLEAARYRKGKRGGAMLIFDTTNEYETITGRPLLTEHQSIIQRLVS
jgi:acyl dehydratase